MKNLVKKSNGNRLFTRVAIAASTFMVCGLSVFADSPDFTEQVRPIVELINSFLTPLIAIVGAVGTLYCVLLGVKYARAEEPQDREKAKAHLKGAIIGFVLIFILIVALKLFIGPMMDWASSQKSTL